MECFLRILKDFNMKRLIIVFFTLFSVQCFSQLTLTIDSIRFTHIVDTIPKVTKINDSSFTFEYDHHMREGPILNLYCSFVNNSSTTIDIDEFIYSTFILFNYNGIDKERYATPCKIESDDNTIFFSRILKNARILPNNRFSFYLSTAIFLLEPETMEKHKEKIYKYTEREIYRYDYTNSILDIIPTIRAKYVGKDINLISDFFSIKEIKIR